MGGGGLNISLGAISDLGRDAISDVLGDDIKRFGENVSGYTARNKQEDEKKRAQGQQDYRERIEKETEVKTDTEKKFSGARIKQKQLMQKGRASTILTQPLGEAASSAAPAAGKTLLGS